MVLDAGSIAINQTDKIKNHDPGRNFRDPLSLIGTGPCPFAYILSLIACVTTGELNSCDRDHMDQKF